VRDGLAPVALGGYDRFDVGFRQFLTDGVGVIPLSASSASILSAIMRNSGPKPCMS
jgi:hypothetical protein